MSGKKQIVPFGRLATNASPFSVQEGSLIESKNVLHRNGVLGPRTGWKRHALSTTTSMFWNGAGPFYSASVNYNNWRHRVLKIFEHSGSLFGIAVRGNPNSSSYTQKDPAVSTGGYVIFRINESKTYTYWANPANYGTSTSPTVVTGAAWELTEHAFQYLMAFDGRSEMVPQIVATKTALLITTAQGVIACPTMLVDEPAKTVNGYNTPGQQMASTTPVIAGPPAAKQPWGSVITGLSAKAYVLDEGDSAAYRLCLVRKLPNGSEVVGEPSARCLVRNTGTAGAGHVRVNIPFPIEWVSMLLAGTYKVNEFVFRVYRTKIFPKDETGAFVTPDETYYAIDEVSTKTTSFLLGYIEYNDILALQSDGESLVISSSTISQLPCRPPHARSISAFGDRVVYGDITDEQRLDFSILAVHDTAAVANSGIVPGTTYTNGDFIIVGGRIFSVFASASGTPPAVACDDDIIGVDDGVAYQGVANAAKRVQQFAERLRLAVDRTTHRRFEHFINAGATAAQMSDLIEKSTCGIDMSSIGPDNSPDASMQLVARRRTGTVSSSINLEVFRPRLVVATTRVPTSTQDPSPIMPTPVIDSSTTVPAGKVFVITGITNAGTFTTLSDHGLSVGDSVHLAVNLGCEAVMKNLRMPFTPGIYVVSSVASATTFTVYNSTHDGTTYTSGSIFRWTYGAPTDRVSMFIGGGCMVRRNTDGATLPTVSNLENGRSVVAWSSPGSPQEVPLAARAAVGNPSGAILAFADIGSGCLVFKEEGVYIAQESYSSAGLTFNLLADGLRLVSKHSFCTYGGFAYAWTTKGVFKISEGGAEPISLEIDDILRKQYLDKVSSNRLLAHMCADTETGNIVLWTVGTQPTSGSNKDIPTNMWVYDGLGWQRFADSSASAFGGRLSGNDSVGYAMYAAKCLTSGWINYMEDRRDYVYFSDELISLVGPTKVSSTVLDCAVGAYNDYIGSTQFGHASAVWAAEQWSDKWATNSSWLIVNSNANDRYRITSAVFTSDPAASTINPVLKVFPNYVRLTLDRALPATVSSAYIITSYESKAILVSNKLDALDGLKRISDAQFVFEQPLFDAGKMIIATDTIPARAEVPLSGFSPGLISTVTSWTPGRYNSALGGKTIRVWPPRSHQRGSQFYIGFSVNEALAYYGLLGVALSAEEDGEHIARRNNG